MPYVDSHAHLDAADFDADREAVIARAEEAGLRYTLLIGDLTRPESVDIVADLAESHESLYWAAGIDPHQSTSARDEHFESLARHARHPKFLAVGEIGLDYYYDYPRDVQKQVFLGQLQAARELGRPVIIHCRDAWSDLRQILGEHFASIVSDDSGAQAASAAGGTGSRRAHGGSRAGILHCFTGGAEDARHLICLGFYVSFAGNLTFKKTEPLREAARALPLGRLLSETDSPYLAPVPYRGQRNEPARVREVTKELAALHGMPEDAMGREITANFTRLFGLEAEDERRGVTCFT
jgi:TatD DNase family protein